MVHRKASLYTATTAKDHIISQENELKPSVLTQRRDPIQSYPVLSRPF